MLETLKKLACTYAETTNSPRLANIRKADLFIALEKREAEFVELSALVSTLQSIIQATQKATDEIGVFGQIGSPAWVSQMRRAVLFSSMLSKEPVADIREDTSVVRPVYQNGKLVDPLNVPKRVFANMDLVKELPINTRLYARDISSEVTGGIWE